MNEQLSYINQLAQRFQRLSDDSAELYKALNSLDEAELTAILKDYGEREIPAD